MGVNVKIGQIVSTQGLKGEMRVYPLTDYLERFEEVEGVFLDADFDKKIKIQKVRYKKNLVILKLEGVDTIEQAEMLRNKYIYVPRESRELPEDTYYVDDLVGLKVYLLDGAYVGVMEDVFSTAGANDVYVIKSEEGREIMIPAVGEFVKEIDIPGGRIVIDPIEGMI
ncbi:ribosome maturation factor RimM [Peptoclostridium acidaminophilum DSM 3953]|uniref:Ribosome maturation factor RimM n=1 Tax=Peptoclostridium acidaminophilum DSM 3953 TaxID=1286171 RepID=W8TFC8_PEPAC|nr:ribosome maturation factor RimM [Peptoclostridium acidaminophilum]AHM56528.1 ribosome maturation factor RimM [Peptoclostridium acidaminophilum DSM 3953]